MEEVCNYEAYKVILGTTKHATGWSASLRKYCAKRLPPTCSVVVFDQWKIMCDRRGHELQHLGP